MPHRGGLTRFQSVPGPRPQGTERIARRPPRLNPFRRTRFPASEVDVDEEIFALNSPGPVRGTWQGICEEGRRDDYTIRLHDVLPGELLAVRSHKKHLRSISALDMHSVATSFRFPPAGFPTS